MQLLLPLQTVTAIVVHKVHNGDLDVGDRGLCDAGGSTEKADAVRPLEFGLVSGKQESSSKSWVACAAH